MTTDLHAPEKRPRGEYGELVAIVIAMVLGAALGWFYGREMWLAGGGPATAIKELEATIAQKTEQAAALDADNPQEAARLRGHIPQVQARLDEAELLKRQIEQNGVSKAAYTAWEFTKFCGELFLQVLKLLVIPLVVTSMVCGITSLGDIRHIGRIGLWTVVYYMCTTAIAVLIGIVLVNIIQPGVGADDTFAFVSEDVAAKEGISAIDTLLNVVRGDPGDASSGMFPSNIFAAAANTNVLALIVFALVFGGAVTTLGEEGRVMVDFFYAANEAVMKMVRLVMWFAPVGIFGLVAYNIAKKGGGAAFGAELAKLSKYVGTVSAGLLLHGIVLSLILWTLGRRNPFSYILGVARALLTAVTTSSSSATLPVTIECVEAQGVSQKSAGFVLPLGATVNMDGTALYEAVAAIFIAQSVGIPLDLGAMVVIFLTATLAAIGAAGIPQAGLVTMVIVLTAVGLPVSGIGLILAIDWFLDRLRTVINVYGDSVGAGVIDRFVDEEG
jgi:Na+/H+-dicarboxylate symporter